MGALSIPGPAVLTTDRVQSPAAACRITTAKVLYPGTATIIYPGLLPHETSVKGSRHSPARPSPHLWPPDDSGALGLYPWASHPRGQDPRTHARAGTGSEH
jgi:hypothetical protein